MGYHTGPSNIHARMATWLVACGNKSMFRVLTWGSIGINCTFTMTGTKNRLSNTDSLSVMNNRNSRESDYALSTLPDLRHAVQTYIFFAAPSPTFTFTCLMLDFQIRLLLLWEWLTLFPKWTALSQIAHLAIIAPPWQILSLQVWYCRLTAKVFYQMCRAFASRNFPKNNFF